MKFFPTICFVDRIPFDRVSSKNKVDAMFGNITIIGNCRLYPSSGLIEIYVAKSGGRVRTIKTLIHELCHWAVYRSFDSKKLHRLIDKLM